MVVDNVKKKATLINVNKKIKRKQRVVNKKQLPTKELERAPALGKHTHR